MKSTTIHLMVYASLVGVALGTGACGDEESRPPGEWVQSEAKRDRSPEVSQTERETLAAGNMAFALDAYHQLRETAGNMVYSPLSVTTAMAMVYAGARGESEAQMASAMHYGLPQSRLHPAFDWLDLGLEEDASDDFELNIVNATFAQTGQTFEPSYLDILARYYGSGVALLDFANDPDTSRRKINAWVEDQTGGRIQDLLPQAAISQDTRMVLANAVYLRAAWKTRFLPEDTTQRVFHAPNGDVTVPMMQGQPQGLAYAQLDGYQAISLPYRNERMSMVFLLPEAGQLEAFETGLSTGTVSQALAALQPSGQGVLLPRFEFEFDAKMSETLKALGMTEVFTNSADLSGMTGMRDLRLSTVAHKAFIRVDETGTEAAAATGAVLVPISLPTFIEINRPFLFLIYDNQTRTVLFLGRVVDPSQGPS